MYFSARATDKFHLWRQRTNGGEPEQITSGPTEEKGFAVAPDGRSVIASVGLDQTAVWLHDANGEHQISGEGNGTWPRFAPDGKKVYYLWAPDLFVTDLTSGHIEKVLPGVNVSSFAISPDGNSIAYTGKDGGLWYGPIDHSGPARKLAEHGTAPSFSAAADIVFKNPKDFTFFRVHPDGTGLTNRTKEYGGTDVPISSISPDGEWAIRGNDKWNLQAYSRRGDRSIKICERCMAGWSPNGKFFWIGLTPYEGKPSMTGLIRLKDKADLPELPHSGIQVQTDLAHIPGIQTLTYQAHYQGIAPSPDGSSFAFVKRESHWNLYRIPLP
jgi:Tol biopolymer transport system component